MAAMSVESGFATALDMARSAHVLGDTGATAIIGLEQLHEEVTRHAVSPTGVRTAISTSPLDYLDDPPPMLRNAGRRPQEDADDFLALVTAHAAYKYPREVEVVDELPKSPTGKILRRTLRARAATEA